MRHIGHPVVGDQLYGKKIQALTLALPGFYSWHVQFEHPCRAENIVVADTLAEDSQRALISQSTMSMEELL